MDIPADLLPGLSLWLAALVYAVLLMAALLALASARPAGNPGGDYLQVIPLLMFGEAFLNGMVMTLLIAYKPRWVATFHDEWYLDGK